MKQRIRIAAMAIVVMAAAFACGSNKAPDANSGTDLPAQMDSVERVGKTLRKKPGFKWENQPDGTVVLARDASTGGAPPDIKRVGCRCDTGPYACSIYEIDDDTIECRTDGDCLSCKFFRPSLDIK